MSRFSKEPPFSLLNLGASEKSWQTWSANPVSVVTEKARPAGNVAADPGPGGLASRLAWRWQSSPPSLQKQVAAAARSSGAGTLPQAARPGPTEHAQCSFQTNQSDKPLLGLA